MKTRRDIKIERANRVFPTFLRTGRCYDLKSCFGIIKSPSVIN